MLTKEELQESGDLIAQKTINVAAVLSNEKAFMVVPYHPFVLSFQEDQLESIIESTSIPHNFGKSINEFWLIVKNYVYHIVPDMNIWFGQDPYGFVVLEEDYKRVGYNYVAKDVHSYVTPDYEIEVSFDDFEDKYDFALMEVGEDYSTELPEEFDKFNQTVKSLILEYNWNVVKKALKDMGMDFAFRDEKDINKHEKKVFRDKVEEHTVDSDVEDSEFIDIE